jgi:hypothetical protein
VEPVLETKEPDAHEIQAEAPEVVTKVPGSHPNIPPVYGGQYEPISHNMQFLPTLYHPAAQKQEDSPTSALVNLKLSTGQAKQTLDVSLSRYVSTGQLKILSNP